MTDTAHRAPSVLEVIERRADSAKYEARRLRAQAANFREESDQLTDDADTKLARRCAGILADQYEALASALDRSEVRLRDLAAQTRSTAAG